MGEEGEMKKASKIYGIPSIKTMYGFSEGKEKKKGIESLFKEIMTDNFPILERDLDISVHEANKLPQNFNP